MEFKNRIISGFALSLSTIYATVDGGYLFTLYLALVSVFCYAEWHLLSSHKNLEKWRILGFALIFVFHQSLYFLRQLDAKFVYSLFFIVWATDTGAYFGGKFVSKMENVWRYPEFISKKKTFFGSFTGVLFGTSFGLYLKNTLWISILLSILSQFGDLLESRAKRLAEVKDSNIAGFEIPGHGGILDRVDALILATPFAYVFFRMQ